MSQTWADPAAVAAHYTRRLGLETDCADVADALDRGGAGFVLLDVRTAESFKNGHIPGAVHLRHSDMTVERMAAFPEVTKFVVYCWGPHCNGASKGAANLGTLGYQAKEMLGGIWGWGMEGNGLDVGT